MNRQIVLASSSRYRQILLSRLNIAFESCSPDIDESPNEEENPESLVKRLSESKALAVSARYPNALIIGSDQVGELNGEILNKAGSRDRAVQQLLRVSGQEVRFLTGLCLLDAASNESIVSIAQFAVGFRALSHAEIEAYVDAEQPWDCAGSFRVEGPGIALMTHMAGDDPNSLQGLPLIQLCEMLRSKGINPLYPSIATREEPQ